MNLGHEDNKRIAERAAQYLGALTEDSTQQAALFAWLAESPRHVEEFLFVLRSAEDVAGFTHEQEARIEGMVGSPLDDLGGNVVQLTEQNEKRQPGRSRTMAWRMTGAAAVVALGVFSVWRFAGPGDWQTYTTAVGEQRTVKLADGSMVVLNTDSRLKVRFADNERTLQLAAGEALFTAARDAARPFRVHAGDTVIEAIGTQFGVYRSSTGTRVSVLEGVVQVESEAKTAQTAPRLNAGEEANVATDGKIVNRRRLDPAKAVAWQQRRLVFEDETLETIVAEFNRYNIAPQIRVLDTAAGARRFSGTFDADAPETMINTLAGDETLTATRSGREIMIRSYGVANEGSNR